MNQEKSRNFGPPDPFFHGEIALIFQTPLNQDLELVNKMSHRANALTCLNIVTNLEPFEQHILTSIIQLFCQFFVRKGKEEVRTQKKSSTPCSYPWMEASPFEIKIFKITPLKENCFDMRPKTKIWFCFKMKFEYTSLKSY